MYNVRIIEYPESYQVRMYSELLYEGEDRSVRVNRFTGEVIEKKKRRLVPDQWNPVFFDFEDLDEIIREQKSDSSRWAMTRAKNNLYYIARSNVWEWFVTFTLNKEKIERYDYDVLSKRIRKWFNNLKQRKAPDMYYLIVPEQHKDGAWHFHGLIGGSAGLTFLDSGKLTDDGAKIYNLDDWGFGFTEATKVVSTERVSSYICKYITKELCEAAPGRQRYWVSQNCARAPISKELVPYDELQEYKYRLYDKMSYKKRVQTEYMDIDYFEIPKEREVFENENKDG